MRWPCRCNRRSCQARRTLPKHPREYVRWPVCKVCGEGRLYVDEYRKRKGPKDNVRVCRSDCRPYPHRVSDRHCKHYRQYVTSRNLAPRSKHSPIPPDEWVPF